MDQVTRLAQTGVFFLLKRPELSVSLSCGGATSLQPCGGGWSTGGGGWQQRAIPGQATAAAEAKQKEARGSNVVRGIFAIHGIQDLHLETKCVGWVGQRTFESPKWERAWGEAPQKDGPTIVAPKTLLVHVSSGTFCPRILGDGQ